MANPTSNVAEAKKYRIRVRASDGQELVSEVVELAPRSEMEPGPHELQFLGETGEPLESEYLLEHPDGKIDEGELDKGVIHLDSPDSKQVKVHFPELIEARFNKDSIDWQADGSPPELEVVLQHLAQPKNAEAIFSFSLAQHGESDSHPAEKKLGEVRAALTASAKPDQPQETRARWKVTGFAAPGEGESCYLLCQVQVRALQIDAGELVVHGPPAKEGAD